MCTAVSFNANDHYFGRNLDVEGSYGQTIIIAPVGFEASMRCLPSFKTKNAIIGMAIAPDHFPLYFDATNDKGLSIAGLNFPQNAVYHPQTENKSNITPFELPVWLLGLCDNVNQARVLLKECNIVNISYSADMPLSPLHWLVADKHESIVVESTKDGLQVYDNPYGVLTNNPPFNWHLMNMNNYLHLHNAGTIATNTASTTHNYSLGLGALGLPGDFSSASRFVKVAFVKNNSTASVDENENVNQFFHILSSVAMPKGCVKMPNGAFEYTLYSSCCNTEKGIYYYISYYNSEIRSVDINKYRNSMNLIVFDKSF